MEGIYRDCLCKIFLLVYSTQSTKLDFVCHWFCFFKILNFSRKCYNFLGFLSILQQPLRFQNHNKNYLNFFSNSENHFWYRIEEKRKYWIETLNLVWSIIKEVMPFKTLRLGCIEHKRSVTTQPKYDFLVYLLYNICSKLRFKFFLLS